MRSIGTVMVAVAGAALLVAAGAAADTPKPAKPAAPASVPAASKHVRQGAPAAASAAGGKVAGPVAQKPNGYVVRSKSFTANPGGQTRGQVGCPSPKVPLGGGVGVAASDLTGFINSSFPLGRKWVADVNNIGAASTGFTVVVVCGRRPASYGIFSASFSSPAGSQSSGSVGCPSGSVALGGGALSNSGSTTANINSDLPEGTGWRVDMNNASASDTMFSVYAVCARAPLRYSVVAGPNVTNPAGAETLADAFCPSGSVPTGGGPYSGSGSVSVNANSTIPILPGTWRVYEDNASASDTYVRSNVVCA